MQNIRMAQILGLGITIIVSLTVYSTDANAARKGDRIGVRGGLWPQDEASGALGKYLYADNDSVYTAVAGAPSSTALALEAFVLFNLRRSLWFEGSIGWMRRRDVSVLGVLDSSVDDDVPNVDLLGIGRIDFVPVFVGARLAHDIGQPALPHSVYGRAGVSFVFASESPEIVYDRVRETNLYSEGSEASLGFLLGAGAEYYLTEKFGLTVDATYRYNEFSYSNDGNFDISSVVLMVGICYRSR